MKISQTLFDVAWNTGLVDDKTEDVKLIISILYGQLLCLSQYQVYTVWKHWSAHLNTVWSDDITHETVQKALVHFVKSRLQIT